MEVSKEQVKYVPMNKFRTFRQEQTLEKELEELKNPKKVETEPENKEEKLSIEEETWKKRYGDLRSYSQKQYDDLNKKITDLTSALEAATKKEIQYPKTEDEVNEWAQKFPDIYKIFKTMAMKEVQEAKKELDEVKSEIAKNKHLSKKQESFQKLLELHPDFPELIKTKDWAEWPGLQDKETYDTIYVNETDYRAAARTIDLYKYYLMKKDAPKKEAETRREAAQSVQLKSAAPEVDNGKKVWSESKVAKLNDREYAKYKAEIAEARANGTFEFDLSAAAF